MIVAASRACFCMSAWAPRFPETFPVASPSLREAVRHADVSRNDCRSVKERRDVLTMSARQCREWLPKVSGSSFPRPNFGLDQNLDAEILPSPESAETPGSVQERCGQWAESFKNARRGCGMNAELLKFHSASCPRPSRPGAQKIYSAEERQKVWWSHHVSTWPRVNKMNCCRVTPCTVSLGGPKKGAQKCVYSAEERQG